MAILSLLIAKNRAKVAIINEKTEISATAEYGLNLQDIPCGIADICSDFFKKESICKDDIEYIGITGNTGELDRKLEAMLGIPVKSCDRIGALALGETYINGGDAPSSVLLYIGDKTESAVVIEHKLLSNNSKDGAGLGHSVISMGGYECVCGRRGCLEAYVCTEGVRRTARESGLTASGCITLEEIFIYADQGNENAVAAKDSFISHLACGITNIINLFQPHELVIMGPLTEIGERLTAPLMKIVLSEQYTRHSPNKCKVRFSAPSDMTAMIGTALLGR